MRTSGLCPSGRAADTAPKSAACCLPSGIGDSATVSGHRFSVSDCLGGRKVASEYWLVAHSQPAVLCAGLDRTWPLHGAVPCGGVRRGQQRAEEHWASTRTSHTPADVLLTTCRDASASNCSFSRRMHGMYAASRDTSHSLLRRMASRMGVDMQNGVGAMLQCCQVGHHMVPCTLHIARCRSHVARACMPFLIAS